jgi:hypothetical protein
MVAVLVVAPSTAQVHSIVGHVAYELRHGVPQAPPQAPEQEPVQEPVQDSV